jgi:hypothetical protein
VTPREEIIVRVPSDLRREAVAAVLWAYTRALAKHLIETSPRLPDLLGRARRSAAHDPLVRLRALVVVLGRLERLELGDQSITLPFARVELVRRIDWLLSLSESAPDAAAPLERLLGELGRWRDELA